MKRQIVMGKRWKDTNGNGYRTRSAISRDKGSARERERKSEQKKREKLPEREEDKQAANNNLSTC